MYQQEIKSGADGICASAGPPGNPCDIAGQTGQDHMLQQPLPVLRVQSIYPFCFR